MADPSVSPGSAPRIAAIGEILWDIFPTGPRFGGAPANFACSAAGLAGGRYLVSAVSAVGEDELGGAALESLAAHRVDTSHVATNGHETGKVIIQLDSEGRAAYEFAENTAWDRLAWTDELERHASELSAVCFGTLGQRSETSRETIRRFVRRTPPAALRVFDINLRPPYFDDAAILESLELANVLKLNDEELPVLSGLCGMSGSNSEILRQLAARFGLRAVALTLGDKGALLLRGVELSEHGAASAKVVDTVGAGDAFTASLVLGLLGGHSLAAINSQACEVAAYVCSQPGASPQLPNHLVQHLPPTNCP